MNHSKIIKNERMLNYTTEQIFTTFERGDLLEKWWGPKDFSNTFDTFEFKTGGRWNFVMHAPTGENYPNECLFKEVIPNKKVVIEHVGAPKFVLTINLIPHVNQTHLTWDQDFETLEIANSIRSMCMPANEQNLDRLEVVLKELD